jgi:hypothetical protein
MRDVPAAEIQWLMCFPAGEDTTTPCSHFPSAAQAAGCESLILESGKARVEEVAAPKSKDHPSAQVRVKLAEVTSVEEKQCTSDDEWGMLNSDSVTANASVMRHLARAAIRKYLACKAPVHQR